MSAEMVTALSGVGVSVATAAGSWLVARAGRRTRQQERRDDFTAVTARMDKEIKRLEGRVERQESRITDQDAAIAWLTGRLRSLLAYTRKAGLEPPPPPPMPPRVQEYLTHIDV
jgi:hypothetical protein